MRQMQMQLAELCVQLNTSSQTTQTAQDLGAVSNYPFQLSALQVNGCRQRCSRNNLCCQCLAARGNVVDMYHRNIC